MTETTAGDMGTRHDAATFNEVNALINRDAEGFVPFSQRLAITNRFLDWHHAKVAEDHQRLTEEIAAAIEGELEVYGSYADQVLTRAAKIARDIEVRES